MTKHAVEGLTKAMALDLASYGIRVNAVAPTYVETPMTRPFFAEGRSTRCIAAYPPRAAGHNRGGLPRLSCSLRRRGPV